LSTATPHQPAVQRLMSSVTLLATSRQRPSKLGAGCAWAVPAAILRTMIDAAHTTLNLRRAATPWASAIAALLLIGFILVLVLTALGQSLGMVPVSWPLVILDARLPIVFRLHMGSAAIAIALIPAVILLRHRPKWHRRLGRIAVIFVVVGGATALPSAILSHATTMAQAGFLVQGVIWLGLIVAGVRAIRARDKSRHVTLMLAMAAVGSGAVWLRPLLAAALALDLPYEISYAILAWAAWLIPLATMLWLRGRHQVKA